MTRYVPVALSFFVLLSTSRAFAQSTIQGVVKDNVGNGMENVHVQIAFSGKTRTATTDSQGRYAISGIPAGACTITFEADRYVTVKRQVTAPANGSVSVDASMNAEETVSVRDSTYAASTNASSQHSPAVGSIKVDPRLNMPSELQLHVTSSILAVAASAEHKFVTIPAGATIQTSDDLVEPGLHRVMFDGRTLLAFTRDIQERTAHLDGIADGRDLG